MIEIYGASAQIAAQNCATAAICDERDDDYRFWLTVASFIKLAQQARREAAQARWRAQGLALI